MCGRDERARATDARDAMKRTNDDGDDRSRALINESERRLIRGASREDEAIGVGAEGDANAGAALVSGGGATFVV